MCKFKKTFVLYQKKMAQEIAKEKIFSLKNHVEKGINK